MPSKYTISDHQAPHFITFATVQWVDALSRPSYKDIIVESLRYCQNEKGLILYAWCVMSNHIHLIVAAQEGCNLPSSFKSSAGDLKVTMKTSVLDTGKK